MGRPPIRQALIRNRPDRPTDPLCVAGARDALAGMAGLVGYRVAPVYDAEGCPAVATFAAPAFLVVPTSSNESLQQRHLWSALKSVGGPVLILGG